MVKLFGVIALFCALNSFAIYFPPSIDRGEGRSGKAVFVDFLSANYKITYDLGNKKVWAKSLITFIMPSSGFPLFDLVPEPKNVKLNGKDVTSSLLPFPNVTTMRVVDSYLENGEYTLEMEHEITANVKFSFGNEVRSAFWTDDLHDRGFLELYLPSNLEYDQYAMEIEVKVEGASKDYDLITNGAIEKRGTNDFNVKYPEYFNASSIYYHLMPSGAIPKIEEKYTTIDGREVPLIIYSNGTLLLYKQKALATLGELEKDYGPWPHKKIIIYGGGYGGGMEYCGATETDLNSLGHELTHSYFARGVMPAQGNSGWIDEAMASWRDGGYQQYSQDNLTATRMAGHSVYQRQTDGAAYSSGMRFLGHLDQKFSAQGGLKKFMRFYFEKNLFNPYLTQTFEQDLDSYFATDLGVLFGRYIYGTSMDDGSYLPLKSFKSDNPVHRIRSKSELLELL